MDLLDNLDKIKKQDKSNLLSSIDSFSLQLSQTIEELKSLSLPADYARVNKVILNGMGGSRLGGRVIERLFFEDLKVPIIPIGSYTLPGSVDENTLVILSSYSGDTEEVLSSLEQAEKKKAKIIVFSQNGELSRIAKQKGLSGFFNFSQAYNPCGMPRMGIGYQIMGIVLLLIKSRVLKVKESDLSSLIKFLDKSKKSYQVDTLCQSNPAKLIAKKFQGRIPILVAAEFLVGCLHVFRNQVHENSKQLCQYFEIPELNHHLLESLSFPRNNPFNLIFLFVESNLYYSKNRARIEVTKKILDKYKIDYVNLKLTGRVKLEQCFELIQFSEYVSYYLAILNRVDPSPISFVDFFKKELENVK